MRLLKSELQKLMWTKTMTHLSSCCCVSKYETKEVVAMMMMSSPFYRPYCQHLQTQLFDQKQSPCSLQGHRVSSVTRYHDKYTHTNRLFPREGCLANFFLRLPYHMFARVAELLKEAPCSTHHDRGVK